MPVARLISNRHIRHDWQTFVDWEQKSVRSLCGVTTRRGLAGIPGITPQPKIVQVGDKKVWGWCPRCIRGMQEAQRNLDWQPEPIHNAVRNLYVDAFSEVNDQWQWIIDADYQLTGRQRQRRLSGVDNVLE